jgi:Uma2 family endonuclease
MQRLFTVEEYHRMAEAGILHEDDRVELIAGKIIQMAAIGSRHAACVKRLIKLLVREVGDSGVVGAQDPIILPDSSEPEPDVTVLRPRDDFYAAGHPVPEDVLLLIEVSDTSLEYDRELNLPLYARAGIPEVWIVDLQRREISLYTQLEGGVYREIGQVHPGDSITPQTLPMLTVRVEDIFG